ncbi:MAG TPA: type II toxin-antitoxin system Phd/YefM family antitoxin [Planctomycetaceae bacterium]|jgi:prevent-host-death family protein
MKSIAVKELKANLDAVFNSAQGERIIVSRHGKPSVVLVGIEGYDAEDLRLATSQDFWTMIRSRREGGKSIPLAEVAACLENTSRKASEKRIVGKKPRSRS